MAQLVWYPGALVHGNPLLRPSPQAWAPGGEGPPASGGAPSAGLGRRGHPCLSRQVYDGLFQLSGSSDRLRWLQVMGAYCKAT